MKPGLMMVFDPRPQAGARALAGMLASLRLAGTELVTAGQDGNWAAAAIAPPRRLAHCDAGIATDHGDTLIWTGDVSFADNPVSKDTGHTLLEGLRKHGIDYLGELDGSFCGAWYEGERGRWSIFNDRFGLLPIFYARCGDRLVIGPTARLTWQASGLPLVIDEDGVVDLLRTTNMTDEHTLIQDVRWLEGGHAIEYEVEARRLRTRRYWAFQHQSPTAQTKDDAIEECRDVFEKTIRRQTTDAEQVMLGISGGLDSRLILAIAHGIGIKPSCYTAGFSFDEDVRFGRQLARVAGASHDFIELNADDFVNDVHRLIIESDGLHSAGHLAVGSSLPHYLAAQSGDVLLEGYLLGLVGGSGLPAEEDVADNLAPHACDWARKHSHSGGNIERINDLLNPSLGACSYERWRDGIDDRYRRAIGGNADERVEYSYVNGRCGRIDVLGTGFLRGDKIVRSAGTERAFLDWCARTPIAWRRGKRLYMDLLRRYFPRFARVQRTHYSGLPVSNSGLLRQWCWQREKAYRFWAARRWPDVRRWGTGSALVRARFFQAWHREGGLDQLMEPNARILNWVRRDELNALWQQALSNPGDCGLLLTLGTIETTVRHLEDLPSLGDAADACAIASQSPVPTNEQQEDQVTCASL